MWAGSALDRRSLDEKDVLSGGVERLNLASPGFLTKAEGATTQVTPILVDQPAGHADRRPRSSAMMPDPVGLLRAYKPEGKALMLAARVAGDGQQRLPRRRAQAAKKERRQGQGRRQGAKPGKEKPKDEAKDAKPKEEKAEAAAPRPPSRTRRRAGSTPSSSPTPTC